VIIRAMDENTDYKLSAAQVRRIEEGVPQ
jgi:hypothetical protein